MNHVNAVNPERSQSERDCPICSSVRLTYLFESFGKPIWRCGDCGFLFRHPIPTKPESDSQASEAQLTREKTSQDGDRVAQLRDAVARQRLDRFQAYSGLIRGKMLLLGCGHAELLAEASRRGFDVAGLDGLPGAAASPNAMLGELRAEGGGLDRSGLEDDVFDACVLTDVIDQVEDPVWLMTQLSRSLKPGGALLLTTASVEGMPAALLKRSWMQSRPECLGFFGRATIENTLAKAGFEQVVLGSDEEQPSQDNVLNRLLRSSRASRGTRRLMVLARPGKRSGGCKLSIILPAYNESATFPQVMDTLVAKDLDGLEKEIIVVESNSTDGTREAALRFRDHPEVTLVLEDKPCGKGRAVRSGLARATGDFVMIQDADLEYDFNDYDALLEPLRNYRTAFVLGIRHGGDWKMRHFADNPWLEWFMNFGHVVFTGLLNLLYGQRLKDPFTMFKVFRRDCLFGLNFESDRFDFDYELVIKLLRKGYRPIEVPVNYTSRSFSQGKKVRVLRDPITWIWALAKFRFVPLYKPSDRIRW